MRGGVVDSVLHFGVGLLLPPFLARLGDGDVPREALEDDLVELEAVV